MKHYLSRLLALVLVVAIGLAGCAGDKSNLTGNYRSDTLAVVSSLKAAIEMPDDSPEKAAVQADARQKINDFAARYNRGQYTKLTSFTTMRTALNSLAAHYNAYPNRPLPKKLKDRLETEFQQVEAAIQRGA